MVNNMGSEYDHNWVDDERGPTRSYRRHYPENDEFIPINELTKQILHALDEKKWSTQWNEVEWKNLYFENPNILTEDDEYFDDIQSLQDDPDHIDQEPENEDSKSPIIPRITPEETNDKNIRFVYM
jgi:hypothetical protein